MEIWVEGDRLWKHVLVARHGAACGGWSTGLVRGSHGCGLWKGIILGWESFNAHFRYKVGIGDTVRLWHDKWCGDVILKEAFPMLYECASNQAATISEMVDIRACKKFEKLQRDCLWGGLGDKFNSILLIGKRKLKLLIIIDFSLLHSDETVCVFVYMLR